MYESLVAAVYEVESIPVFVARVLQNKPPIIYGDGEQTRDSRNYSTYYSHSNIIIVSPIYLN